MSVRVAVAIAALVVVAALPLVAVPAQLPDTSSFVRAFTWRNLGPFLGGRTTAAAGIPGQPNVFIIGTANGGVWKTTDAGRTWRPVFDDQPTGAIGAIAIAPSNVRVLYAGTGAMPTGDDSPSGNGIYRSNDGGENWTHLGLAGTEHIVRIALDPRDANRLFVAALGPAYRNAPDRGVFRSTDGGRSFERVLFTAENTGATDVLIDPQDSRVVYAAMSQVRPPAVNATPSSEPAVGLYRSNDGGTTWRKLGGLQTPSGSLAGRMSLAAVSANGSRLFALAAAGAGLYTSTDAGETWSRIAGTERLAAAEQARVQVAADSAGRPLILLVGDGIWRSADSGASFQQWLPGSVTYEDVWINPSAPDVAIAAGSRGATVTVNGGATWTSADQPFGRFAHVAIDAVFPFRVCGADAASGAGCLPLRGDAGRIRPQDWRVVGTTGSGFVVPDPIDPEIVYSGSLSRFDRRTNQTQEVAPTIGAARRDAAPPIVFAPTDARALIFADDVVWKSTNAGQAWTMISPSLAADTPDRAANLPAAAGTSERSENRAVVSVVTPSYVDSRLIWAATSDARIHVTRDGGTTWRNVTPPETPSRARIAAVEGSHFDANTVYVAMDRRRVGDDAPHVLRSRDGGATWTDVTAGLPPTGAALAVREDPFRRGLLFVGTAQSVFVSFDDGDRWQPLRSNLPPTAIRDLAIREATLVAATDGRGLWALDDISPLRQLTADIASADAFLFRPATAWRSGRRTIPGAPDEVGLRVPEGVALWYLVGSNAAGPVTLDIIETATGDVIRRFSSTDVPATLDGRPGLHQLQWDLRYTPVRERSPMVLPGAYQVRLMVNGQPLRQAVLVRLDPVVRTPAADLATLLKHARAINAARAELVAALSQSPEPTREQELSRTLERLDQLFDLVQQTDSRPTVALEGAIATTLDRVAALFSSRP